MSRTRSNPIFGIAAVFLLGLTSSCIRFTRAAALEQPVYILETCLLSAEMKVQNDWAEPAEAKAIFKKGTDKNVFSFIRLKDMLGEHKLFWKWYEPSGKLYRLTDAITIGKVGQMFETYIAWDQIFPYNSPHTKWKRTILMRCESAPQPSRGTLRGSSERESPPNELPGHPIQSDGQAFIDTI